MKRKAIESPEGTPVPAAADHNDPEYAFLSTYIKKAIGPRYRTNDLSKDDHMPPILRGNCMNRVILYRGSFNPPHLGHLNLLKHAFTECGEDWNVIGAIVFVLPDSSLDYKFGHTSGTLKFSRRQRGQLWREGLADINWAFPYAYKLDWDGFLDRLRYAIEGDGLQVEFVALMGGDYLTKVSGFTYHRASQHRVTTDISRQVDFHSSDSVTTPEALVGHHPWTRVSIGPPSFRKLAIDAELFRMSNRLKEMQLDKGASSLTYLDMEIFMNEAFAKYHQSEEAAAKRHLWVCKSKHNNANTTRFVHTDKQLNHNISSTKVREIIAQNPIDIWGGKNVQKSSLARLEKKLEGIALSPKTLVRFIESKSKKKQGS